MNDSIVSALVAGIAGVIAAAIGLLGNRGRSDKKRSLALWEIQLNQIFAPLDLALSFDGLDDESAGSLIINMIKGNYQYVPVKLYNLGKQLLSGDDVLGEARTYIASYYNWLRKKQGLPFEKSLIRSKDRPHDEIRQALVMFLFLMLLVWSFISVFFSIGSILWPTNFARAPEQFSALALITFLAILVVIALVGLIKMIRIVEGGTGQKRTKK